MGRIAADADQPTLAESLAAIADSRLEYSLSWVARIVSGGALVAAAYLMWTRALGSEGRDLRPVLVLFAISGIWTVLSGVSSALLTAMAPAADALMVEPGPSLEAIEVGRWVFGKAGFAASGLALLAATRPLFRGNGAWRIASPVTLLLGGSMLFIWLDAATALHRISGPAFIGWLVVAGALLMAGKAKGAFRGESAAA